jgi:hypothetical protein
MVHMRKRRGWARTELNSFNAIQQNGLRGEIRGQAGD